MADQIFTQKKYIYKVFDSDDNFLGTWDDVVSDFEYSQEINKAGASVTVRLGRTSDSISPTVEDRATVAGDTRQTVAGQARSAGINSLFIVGGDSDVELNHRVEVYVFFGQLVDRETVDGQTRETVDGQTRTASDGSPSGRLVFTGYISKFVSNYGGTETTDVTLLSHGAELQQYLLESGSNTTVTYSSQDPTTILKDILDKFTAAGGTPDYDNTSTTQTGTTVSYTFKVNTVLEAIEQCLRTAPTDWFWYIDMATNIIYFRPRPVIVSHKFVLGKHIKDLKLEKHIENLVNVVYFTGGPTAGVNLFNKYTDSQSITDWRRGIQKITDNRVTNDTSAQIISESIIDRYKDPVYRSEIIILDRDYPTEEIQVGELIGFSNFNNFIDNLTIQVVAKRCHPDYVVLQLDTLLPSVSKRVEDVRRNLETVNVLDNPTAP